MQWVKLYELYGVIRYELQRELKKRSIYFLTIIAFLPIILGFVLKAVVPADAIEHSKTVLEALGIDPGRFWAIVFGLETAFSGELHWFVPISQLAGLINWFWLIAILYGGDLIASDIRDKSLHLIVIRPVGRLRYVFGKVLAVSALLATLYIVSGLATFAASWILMGPQKDLHELLGYSLLLTVSTLPLLLLSALFGALTRNPIMGMVLGFVAYFGGSLASWLVVTVTNPVIFNITGATIEAQRRYWEQYYLAMAVNPVTAGEHLPRFIYLCIHHGCKLELAVLGQLMPGRTIEINVTPLLAVDIATIVSSIIALIALIALWLLKRDL